MKSLICERCGSTLLEKTASGFVCPYCGTKYQTEGEKDSGSLVIGRWGYIPIEWMVLESAPGISLVVSKEIIDAGAYAEPIRKKGLFKKKPEEPSAAIGWETSHLRIWMNGVFFEEAFTKEEKGAITKSIITNDAEKYYPVGNSTADKVETLGVGQSTEDYVFCLSIKEAFHLFENNAARKAPVTMHAKVQGAITFERCGSWWLRTPSETLNNETIVDVTGVIKEGGCGVDVATVGIRPAMYVKTSYLDSLMSKKQE